MPSSKILETIIAPIHTFIRSWIVKRFGFQDTLQQHKEMTAVALYKGRGRSKKGVGEC